MRNCIADVERITKLASTLYPIIPAAPPILAMDDSMVSENGVSHFTSAKDVNENRKVIAAAQRTAGPIKGIHKFRKRLILLFPPGRRDSCSSHLGSNVAKGGSTNLITRDRLNHA
jgi:hypothetical protein